MFFVAENCGSPKNSGSEGRSESRHLVQRSASKDSRDGSRPCTPKSTPKSMPKLASLGRESKGSQSSSSTILSRQSSRDSKPSTPKLGDTRDHSSDSASSSPLLPQSYRSDSKPSTPKLTDRDSSLASPSFNNNGCDYIEEEKPLVPGVTIRAASLSRLVTAASHCFGKCNTFIKS